MPTSACAPARPSPPRIRPRSSAWPCCACSKARSSKRTSREPRAPSANRWRRARSSRCPRSCMVEGLADLRLRRAYWKSTALMLVGSVLGVLFVSLIRRVMVEDPELPFPESVAASEIHKAGQARRKSGEVSVLQHRLRRSRLSGRRVQPVRRRPRFLLPRRPARARARCGWAARPHQHAGHRRSLHRAPRPPSAPPISAWATSSDPNWRRSTSPAAWWRGAC